MRKLIFFIVLLLCKPASTFAKMHTPSKMAIVKYINKTEEKEKLPKGSLQALIEEESNYNVFAKNMMSIKKGVYVSSFGLGQLTVATAKNHCKLAAKAILDPFKNIRCSAKVFRYQLDRYNQDLEKAVAAYNIGTPCICNGKRYVREINNKIKTCVKTKTKKIYTCAKTEIGLFLNQAYVDIFFEKYARIGAIP